MCVTVMRTPVCSRNLLMYAVTGRASSVRLPRMVGSCGGRHDAAAMRRHAPASTRLKRAMAADFATLRAFHANLLRGQRGAHAAADVHDAAPGVGSALPRPRGLLRR